MSEEKKSTFKVHSENDEGFTVSNSVRDFELISDEPQDMGGSDEGPNPVEYILVGLGSCLCIMARMLSRKMRLDLESVSVDVEGDIDLRGMEGAEDVRAGFQQVRAELNIDGEISEDDKEKLLNMIELSCPVEDSLAHQVDVDVCIS